MTDGPDERPHARDEIGGAHPDLTELALLVPDDDGTTGPIDAGVREHVDGCAACTTRLAELPAALDAVRADLADLPQPAMPDDVAARIDAALAASTGNVLPLAPRRRRFGGGALAGSAAAAAVLLFVGAVVVGNMANDDEGATSAVGSGAEVAYDRLPTVTSSGHNYTRRSLDGDLPDLLAGNFADLPAPAAAPGAVSGGTTTDQFSEGSGTARGGIKDKQTNGLRGTDTTPAAEDAPAARDEDLTLKTDATFLARCLLGLELEPGSTAAAVDLGTFQGKDAAIIVITRPAVNDSVDVFVVPPDCAAGQLLYYERVPLGAP